MKFLVLTREITNGGDFLIKDKSRELLEHHGSCSEFVYEKGFNDFEDRIDYLKSFDGIILCGGPLYDNRFLNPESYPLFRYLKEIKVPIHILGAGWYGKSTKDEEIYSYKFSEETIEIFNYIKDNGGILGCRDITTVKVLNNNGFMNTIMTGCPVWYDYEQLQQLEIVKKELKKIVISDPGLTKNPEEHQIRALQAISVIDMVRHMFPNIEILFTFNHGIKTKYSAPCNEKIQEYLDNNKINYVELAGSSKTFKAYDDCDLHIGYRVHSHIYCLSKRIPSILISEDARGGGLDRTLGLDDIYASIYDDNGCMSMNPYLLNTLKSTIEETKQTNYLKIENAFTVMKYYYENNLLEFLRRIGVEGEF